jgi:amidohydrolase
LSGYDVSTELSRFLRYNGAHLIEIRRTLHAYPEVGYHEYRTTQSIKAELETAGLDPKILPKGTGLTVDVGPGDGPIVALRADIDALPIPDHKSVPYRSKRLNVCHACGHDVHTAVLIGVGMMLAKVAASHHLPGTVRLIFQPAEELSGGAVDVLKAGALKDVSRIYALHCDPKVEVGRIATRTGPITAGCHKIAVELSRDALRMARGEPTSDLIDALGKIIGDAPILLARRMEPSAGVSLVWGRVVGSAENLITDKASVEGTLRCLDERTWQAAPEVLGAVVDSLAQASNVVANVRVTKVAPPAVNDGKSTKICEAAAEAVLGADAVEPAEQSMGGEDFAWYLQTIPGCLFRLGTRAPRSDQTFDIHQSIFDVDEAAINIGVALLTSTALQALEV